MKLIFCYKLLSLFENIVKKTPQGSVFIGTPCTWWTGGSRSPNLHSLMLLAWLTTAAFEVVSPHPQSPFY